MESGSDRAGRAAENFGDLGRLESEVIAKDENGAFFRREPAERPIELVPIRNAQQLVRRGRAVEREHSQVRDPASLPARLLDADIGEQPVHPGIESGRIAEARQVAPGDHQGVLQGILGPSDISEDPMGDREEPVATRPDQALPPQRWKIAGQY